MFDSPLTLDQEPVTQKPVVRDTLPQIKIVATDTTRRLNLDSSQVIQTTDTFILKLSKDTLDAPVRYQATDSAVILIQDKRIILYGKTQTAYKDITLEAPMVELDQQTQILTAVNSKDSLGIVLENAHFKQGENEFFSDTIRFNFKTQRGLTKNTITQQGEMFVHGEAVKKVGEVTWVQRGMFTTCNLDDPHFAFKANKIKVVNQKVAVSGPTHPEFEGVPVPVYLPFGFFPLSQGRHSGLLPPRFATNEQMGLGLEGLGYYKVINDYWDVKLYGNIYSYGGWSANLNPNYRKRYRYQGGFTLSVLSTKQNFKGDPDYYSNKSYFVTWSHSSDSRARPGTTFSANVNAGSTTFNENLPNEPDRNFQNQLGSSIAYSKTWRGTPFNLTLSANHNQNNQTRLININLPDAGFTMNTIYPFQKKEFVGTQKWYEKLGIGYNGNLRNQFAFYDTAVQFGDLLDTLRWGAQHNIPISVSLPALFGGALIVAPSVSYSQVWINQKFNRKWNTATQKVDSSYTKGFYTDHSLQFSLGMNTAVFGLYQFRKSRVEAIRHVIRPSFSVNYKPDLSKGHYYTDTVYAGASPERLNEFEGAIFPGYSEGKVGGFSFQLDNTLEMKWRSKKDTTNTSKVIQLIDGFGFSTSYNFLVDSMNLEPLNLYFRTNLFQKINLSASAILNPYVADSIGRNTGKYVWEDGKFKLGRIQTGSISLSTTFQSKPKDPKKDEELKKQIRENLNSPELQADQQRLLDYARQNPSEFVDFNIPWQISISYSLNFYERRKADYSGFEREFSSNINFNGSFNLTPKWNFSMNGYYDFETNQIQTFTMMITREMHCWQLSANVTPVGLYRYFNISISPKASVLQDLKINRTRSFSTY